jgi:hypothetical protein
MSQKNRCKTRAKKKGKTKGDKKPNKKRRKYNKTLSQKSEKGQEKNLTKGNKRKEPKIKFLAHELLASTLLSNASSLVIYQSFKFLFTDSSYVKFVRPLSLFLLSVRLITPLRIGDSAGLRCICPNHLKRCCTSFSTGATPSLSCMSLFRTRSLLVWPQIHCSMRISATFSCCTCRLLVGQYSASYNMAGRIAVL